jgi:hypothetical protein
VANASRNPPFFDTVSEDSINIDENVFAKLSSFVESGVKNPVVKQMQDYKRSLSMG